MIRFGSMSIVLLGGALYGVLLATLLWFAPGRRGPHRFLALLIGVLVLRLLPYVIGYAGYYDAYPWLSFAPYNWSLAFGPLLYGYVLGLTAGRAPRRLALHFLPAAVQCLYYCCLFVQPLAWKNAWDAQVHLRWIDPFETALTLASIGVYLALSLRQYRRHQRWLAEHSSQSDYLQLAWLRNFLLALALTLAAWTLVAVFDSLFPLDYFQRFPLYAWFALLVYYLGTQGYRNSSLPIVHAPARGGDTLAAAAGDAPAGAVPPDTPARPPRDWTAQGELWRQRLASEQWWRDPALTLADLARQLGTNTGHLSRAINDGLGCNFNALVNGLRVDAVRRCLDDASETRELLAIALDCGFSSKASFNRTFKDICASTPSAYRDRDRGRSSEAPAPASKPVA